MNPCDLLEKIADMNSEVDLYFLCHYYDNLNFLRCLVSVNGDGKAFTLLVLRLKELNASSIVYDFGLIYERLDNSKFKRGTVFL